MFVKGADIAVLLNPAAAIIIIIGTSAAVMNSFPKNEFLRIPKLFGVLFRNKANQHPVEIIKQIMEMAQKARKDGLLALEQDIQSIDNEFMKKGLGLIIDGLEKEYITEVMNYEIESIEERHRSGAWYFHRQEAMLPHLGFWVRLSGSSVLLEI
jgi:chemotaxis protein MotA